MTDPRTTQTVIVQTAQALPSADSGWTTRPDLEFLGGDEGAGQVVGSAEFEQVYGPTIDERELRATVSSPLSGLNGYYVRVLASDSTGGISIGATSYLPVFHGQITATIRDSGGGGAGGPGRLILSAVGLVSVLDQLTIQRGYEVSSGISSPVDPGYCPIFNALLRGDRSASQFSIGGTSVYIHSRARTSGARSRWTARQILQLLLAGHANPALPPDFTTASDITWTLGGQVTALDYEPDRLDLHGYTVLEAINALINPRRGLTWRLVVSGATATITVRSLAPSAITVGSYTLPAADTTTSLTFDGSDPFLAELSITEDASNVYDGIYVVGDFPRVMLSLEWLRAGGGSLVDGWSTVVGWDSLTADPDDPAWRRFVIASDYNGYQLDLSSTDGLRHFLTYTTGTDAAYGRGGYTGERSYLSGGSPEPAPSASALVFDQTLPIPLDTDTTDVTAERAPLVIRDEGSSSYVDLSDRLAMRVDQDPPGFTLGASPRDVGAEIADWFASGVSSPAVRLIFTVAIREPRPLQVSWLRPRSDWPRDLPRIRTIHMPEVQQWVGLKGTVTGTTGSALTTLATDTTYRDDIATLRAALALARPWYTTPGYTVSWIDRGRIEAGTTKAPGALLTSVSADGDTITPNAGITRRRWVRRPYGYDTLYIAKRPDVDIEAIL